MDWDKLRIFHAVVEAGSFTRAGEALGMSQSAVSRQVSALEAELKVPLFLRHARGLIPTEYGELLHKTAKEVLDKLTLTEALLSEASLRPAGTLRVTTVLGLGSAWLMPRMGPFLELYPDISLEFLLFDEELDLARREADVAIWLHEPAQADLIRRPLFTVHMHVYASTQYLRQFGTPRDESDLDNHRILTFGGKASPPLRRINWLETAGRCSRSPRRPALKINSVFGLKEAVRQGVGIAVIPDYLVGDEPDMVPVLEDAALPEFQTYFVYPEELRKSKRVNVFRDFLVARAREWTY